MEEPHLYDWAAHYAAANTPWDLGGPHPELSQRLSDGDLAPPRDGARALVPGCGHGHDALALARRGWVVTAVDLVPDLAETLGKELARRGGRFLRGDVLALVPGEAAPGARAATLHVADLGSAIVALLAAPAWREKVVEFDDGVRQGHSWPEILVALGQAFGRRPRAFRLPRPFFLPVAAGASLISRLTRRPQVLSLGKVAELYHPAWGVTGPDLSDMVNWHPRFGLADGFADTAAWYRRESLI